MQRTEIFGLLAGVMALVAYYFYIKDLVTNPHKDKSLTAWIIWTFIGFLILKSYLTVGPQGQTADSKWLPLIYAVFPPIILAILFFYCKSREAKFSRLDKFFLMTSLISGVYLWYYHEGSVPLHVNMFIDMSGGFLVAKCAWHNPQDESFPAWSFFALAALVNLGAVQSWAYIHCVYPILLAVFCSLLAIIIKFRSRRFAVVSI